jgi:serine/threonine protein kinase
MRTAALPALLAGRYRLERRLGLGGMAVVHLALDTVLDRPVAVKLLAARFADDAELRERFLREGRFAAKLSHPNVVAVFDTGELDGLPYLVMEHVEGASLAEALARRGALPPDEVAELGRQACAGLAHAHGHGLVHRDVKPQNLLLRADGVLKVADFGIARASDAGATLTQAGTLLGTATYMAPEVANGEPATPASDLYSLGAVLYELLAGVPPRRVESLADVVATQPIRPVHELVPGTPLDLATAVMRCLEPDPRRRPASAAELAPELAAGESVVPTQRLARPSTRRAHRAPRRALRLAVAVAAALALALLAVRLGGDGEPSAPPAVEPVTAGASPAEDARNLSEWLRANAAR